MAARLVRQLTREIDRVADDLSALDSALSLTIIRVFDYDNECLNFPGLFFLSAIFVGLEQSHNRARDCILRDLFRCILRARRYSNRFSVLAS